MIDDLLDIFGEIGDEHHDTYKDTDGKDEHWAEWYADKLLDSKEFITLASGTPDKALLIHALLKLDKDFLSEKPNQSWEEYYTSKIFDLL